MTESLLEILATVPDPRKLRGRRHPLPAILGLTVLAMLAGNKTLEAIAQFGRDHGTPLAHALGFRRGKTPAKGTLSKLCRRLDIEAFEAALSRWLLTRQDEGWEAIAIDGKTLRGTKSGETPGMHLLTAFIPSAAAVIAQLRVDAKTNEHKAALQLLGVLPCRGKVVTGDAMFTHRDVAQKILDAGGDYLLIVKDNQPELKAQICSALNDDADFSPYQRKQKAAQEQTAETVDKGHGRLERRRLTSTTQLNGYLDWPKVGQVFEWERVRQVGDKRTIETVYGISSLKQELSGPKRMLALVRGHWGIENKLHYVKDETLGEDRCRVRTGSSPEVLSLLRNVVVYLLEGVEAASKAASTRRFMVHPEEALPLLLT